MAEHANTFFLTTILTLMTILLIFGMKYFSAARRARGRTASDDAFRALAERASSAQGEANALLAALRNELTEVRSRLTSVEKVLKDVE